MTKDRIVQNTKLYFTRRKDGRALAMGEGENFELYEIKGLGIGEVEMQTTDSALADGVLWLGSKVTGRTIDLTTYWDAAETRSAFADFFVHNDRFDLSLMVLKGEPSASPVPPSLIYNAGGVAEFKLADIWVQAGAAQLAQSDIIDQRVWSGLNVNQPHKHDVGMIQWMPFRVNEMPFGWYACDGQTFANTTRQAIALNGLPVGFKTDWGINNTGAVTNVPQWAFTDVEGTRYPFMRGVDGSLRLPGSVEGDAIRNIWAKMDNLSWGTYLGLEGAYSTSRPSNTDGAGYNTAGSRQSLNFDAFLRSITGIMMWLWRWGTNLCGCKLGCKLMLLNAF